MGCFPDFSPDGIHVLLRYHDGTMRLLRAADGVCLATLAAPSHRPVNCCSDFTPDGKTICYTTEDGHVIFAPIGHLLS
ncbi:hypothetical protein C8Q76DRAFT_757121 [Earliella scabrosa]|nr:hypothetical protein C8Q76DRAFT_757121 [Earliella scabrosa]